MKILDIFFTKNNIPLFNIVHSYANEKFSYILSYRTLIVELFVVFSFVSIPSFIKILFDITRYYSKSIKQERHSKSLEIDKLNLEKNFLSAQLNPHFLFNTFNNLYALALKKSTILPEVIERLSDIMRYTVYDASADTVSLNDELNFIKNYIELERLRYSSDSSIELILSENLPINHKIAPLLIFPFVENAFKYGLKSKAKFVKVKVDYIDQMIVFLIENDTIDYENVNTQQYHGVGIANVQSRLKLLYPNNNQLTIKNSLNTFIVELKITI
ncbi:sensor histidine kinase [Rhizosphaericola mali]|nr:histidine kinase [Rhizosphaericola mali]